MNNLKDMQKKNANAEEAASELFLEKLEVFIVAEQKLKEQQVNKRKHYKVDKVMRKEFDAVIRDCTEKEATGRTRVEEITKSTRKLTREVQVLEEGVEQKRRSLMNDQTEEEIREEKVTINNVLHNIAL